MSSRAVDSYFFHTVQFQKANGERI